MVRWQKVASVKVSILKVNNIPMKTVEDLEKVMKEAAKTQEQVLFITGMFPSGKRGSYAVSVAQD